MRARKDRAFRSVSHQDSALTAGPLAFMACVAIDAVDAPQLRQGRARNTLRYAGEIIK